MWRRYSKVDLWKLTFSTWSAVTNARHSQSHSRSSKWHSPNAQGQDWEIGTWMSLWNFHSNTWAMHEKLSWFPGCIQRTAATAWVVSLTSARLAVPFSYGLSMLGNSGWNQSQIVEVCRQLRTESSLGSLDLLPMPIMTPELLFQSSKKGFIYPNQKLLQGS